MSQLEDDKDAEKPPFKGFEKLEHLLRNRHDRELRQAQQEYQRAIV